ncbi:MAG: 50S ribosomal protein L6 [Spirochaetales bacterium]|nr:50S ribosomal protein L6 [Spirochaetales bacterium]
MSRIGLKPVPVPKGVTVTAKDNVLTVKGSKGELVQDYASLVSFKVGEGEVIVERANESKQAKSMHGLYRSLLNNMVLGVSQGYTRGLVINGVGYRAEVKGTTLLLNLGYSNSVEYTIPEGIQVAVEANTKISVSGIDKAQVGQVAAEIRSLRPPEPYKGKGIRYENENVRRKVGKSGK